MGLRSSDGQVSVAAATPTHVSNSIHPGTGAGRVWSRAATLAALPRTEQPRERACPPDSLHAHSRPTDADSRIPVRSTHTECFSCTATLVGMPFLPCQLGLSAAFDWRSIDEPCTPHSAPSGGSRIVGAATCVRATVLRGPHVVLRACRGRMASAAMTSEQSPRADTQRSPPPLDSPHVRRVQGRGAFFTLGCSSLVGCAA
jgi:hypothetical protein